MARIALLLLLLSSCTKERHFPSTLVDRQYDNGHGIVLNHPSTSREDDLVRLTNEYRVSQGLNPMLRVSALDALAYANSQHMYVHGFYSHVNPEGDTADDRISRTEAGRWVVGENIWIVGEGDTAAFILQGFIASPEHNANLLSGANIVGVGLFDVLGATYVTMNFVRA